jgi:transcriptional regulator with XRE-family HTH domain
MDGDTDERPRSLAEKLNHLFNTVHPPHRGPYTNDEVASFICEQGGPSISGTYLWYLRKGERDNPTKKHLEALASFFEVPPSYFFDEEDARAIDDQLALLSALRNARVQKVALRAAGLSPESLKALAKMIGQARKLEGLPPFSPHEKRKGGQR